MSLELLKQLQAENLLAGTHVLSQTTALKNGLRYKSNGTEVAFDDFWQGLTERIRTLPKIELKPRIAPGTEDEYLIQLANALEQVYDRVDQALADVLFFQGKLGTAVVECKNLRASFGAWFTLALEGKLKELDMKLPGKQQSALAESEFSRIVDGVDGDLESLLKVVEVQEQQLKNAKKLALNKYNLGKDQANAAWTSGLPRENGYGGDPEALLRKAVPEAALEEEESEEVPSFVSKRPTVGITGSNSVPVNQEPIKGTFVKTMPAVKLEPVKNEDGQPTIVAVNSDQTMVASPLGPIPAVNPELKELLDKARTHVMTPEEVRLQRISFAAGNLAIDSDRPFEEIRAEVEAASDEIYGKPDAEGMKAISEIARKGNEETRAEMQQERLEKDKADADRRERVMVEGKAILDELSSNGPDEAVLKAAIPVVEVAPPKKAVITITTNRKPVGPPATPVSTLATPVITKPVPKATIKVVIPPRKVTIPTAAPVDPTIVRLPISGDASDVYGELHRAEKAAHEQEQAPVVVSPAPILDAQIAPVEVPVASLPATPRKPLTFTTDDEAVM